MPPVQRRSRLAVLAALCASVPLGLLALAPAAARPAPAPAPASSRDWVKTWANDAGYWLDFTTHYPVAGKPNVGAFYVWAEDAVWKEAEAAGGEAAMPRLVFAVYREPFARSAEPVWKSKPLPIRRPGVAFRIPEEAIPEGSYEARLLVVSEDGRREEWAQRRLGIFDNTWRQAPRAPLHVRPATAEPMRWRKAAPDVDAKPLLTRAVRLGNPNRERFPKDDGPDALARGVKGMAAYDGRVFFGCGDWGANRGPIDIWAYVPPALGRKEGRFVKEGTVDDESIDLFRSFRKELYLPGPDAREDWSFGNLYLRLPGSERWSKRRTVPHGIHVLDVALQNGRLYAAGGAGQPDPPGGLCAGLWVSDDDGMTWDQCGGAKPFPEESERSFAFRFYAIAPFGADSVIAFDQYAKLGLWLCTRDGKVERLNVSPVGSLETGRAMSASGLEPFRGGVLYRFNSVADPGAYRMHLYFLRDLKSGPEAVERFRAEGAGPFFVDGDTVYVMTARRKAEGKPEHACSVYSSKDLRAWRREAAFDLPGGPGNFTRLGGKFYVGVGWDGTPNPEAGSLWVLR